ncbi:hypothetical protein Save01_08103 [Streptomyces avermitilis]
MRTTPGRKGPPEVGVVGLGTQGHGALPAPEGGRC